ncbi:MAG: ABC transporter permease [Bacteroidales bacterium]
MFDKDKWQEIFSTIQKNKLRSFLTGFSVAWGIFMLIILLGSGQGLQNGVETEFKQDAVNSIWLYPGQTSVAYQGYSLGRQIRFTNNDYDEVANNTKDLEYISAGFNIRGNGTISYKNEYGTFDIISCHPGYQQIENAILKEGRFVNNPDIEKYRKVTSIGQKVAEALFKDSANPIGKYIKVNGIPFEVVGVFTDPNERDMTRIYIPVSTAQMVFNGGNRINRISLTTSGTPEESEKLVEQIRKDFAKRHNFDPADMQAMFIRNTLKEYKQMQNLFSGIRIFVWIIGIGTIIAGIVGVSNIMMIVVKERTKEIGIRKAIGATPGSIVSLIIMESVMITGFAGYVGLVLGVGLLQLLSKAMESVPFIKDPQADFSVAIYATLLLIVSGALAGFVPANRAAMIKPIEALRDE